MTIQPKEIEDRRLEIRSEPVDEVLTVVPGWLIRWGMTVMFMVLLMLLLISWFVKYPDIITAPTILTSDNPPVRIKAKTSGKIEKLLCHNNELIKKDSYLLVLKNTAHTDDIIRLKKQLNEFEKVINSPNLYATVKFPSGYMLGEIQPAYSDFLYRLDKYALFFKTGVQHKINLPQEKDKKQWLNLYTAFQQLSTSMEQWEYKYTITAPANGSVIFSQNLRDGQSISPNDELFIVVGSFNKLVAKCMVPARGIGNVKKGQEVLIRLESYPYPEYGILQGIVTDISMFPSNNQYAVNIALPKGLTTSYNIKLDYHQDMAGSADIVTKDMRLIERFFYQLIKIVSKTPQYRPAKT